ncbi:MAG TPA: hypothetical protein VFC90_08445, partial [Planctomycetota bacterium]|nr:hypothetical protein [Planctomycetota bacterium]
MEALKIVLMSVVATMAYRVVQDQVTIRVCVEYVAMGHSPVFATDSPALMAYGRWMIATWWYGLLLGIPLAAAARFGSKPKTRAATLRDPMSFILVRVACYAVLGGLAGYFAAKQGWIRAIEPMTQGIVPEREATYIAVLWAHWTA